MKPLQMWFSIFVMLAFTGCSALPATEAAGGSLAAATATDSVVAAPLTLAAPQATPLPEETSTPAVLPSAAPTTMMQSGDVPPQLQSAPTLDAAQTQSLLDLVKADLIKRLGSPISAADIKSVDITPQVWSDSSLGCPVPDMMYAQMMTPGYRIILTYGDKNYEYHTDSGQQMAFCAQP